MPSPLIKTMIEKYHYPLLTEENFNDFVNSQDECVLFFTENPARYPESDDVAMILPELVKEYGNRFSAAVIDQKDQQKLQIRFGFKKWPSLVFLRQGKYLGVISKVQDWLDYLEKINAILTSEPQSAPGFIIPVDSVVAPSTQ